MLRFCSRKLNMTGWRRFRFWQRRGGARAAWAAVLRLLDQHGKLDLSVGSLDGTPVQSPKYAGSGYSGKHRRTGRSVSLLVDRYGLPLAATATEGSRHDMATARRTMSKLKVGTNTSVGLLNADKGYDSAAFRRDLRKRGIRANIPERQFKHRRKRGRPPLYDKALGRLRAAVERTNAWFKYFRRLRYRWERKRGMFAAFVELACAVICVRRAGF